MSPETAVPVVTVDGPSGVGKGSACTRLAKKYHWHILDSGAIYRLLAVAVADAGVEHNLSEIIRLASSLHQSIEFRLVDGEELPVIYLQDSDVSGRIRDERVGMMASRLAPEAAVRKALLKAQRGFARAPGLIADGRDMGTVVFPEAALKVFLTASAEERARRRHKQLIEKGKSVKLEDLLREIRQRDHQDASRRTAPMKAAPDAIILDTTALSLDEVVAEISRYMDKISVL